MSAQAKIPQIDVREAVQSKGVHHYLTDADMNELYGEKELRWAQIAARNMLTAAVRQGMRRNLIWMPTGSGKTLTIAITLDQNPELRVLLGVKPGEKMRVLYIAHIHRLLTQAERTFVEDSTVELKTTTPFSDIPQADVDWAHVIVIDEAHHEACQSVQLQLDKIHDKPIIGLTATPDRPDGMVIKFENIIQPCTREEAVAEGWLAETSIWSILDTSGSNKVPLIIQTLDNFHQVMGKTIVFVKTKKEGLQIHQHLLTKLHKRSVFLDKQSAAEINQILDDFGAGLYDVIVNCSKIGEGVDVSGVTTVLLGKNIGSYTQLNQYIGRAARPDSDCQVFEFINPLSGRNLDTTVVVGTPKIHYLCAPQNDGSFIQHQFDYVTAKSAGISKNRQIHHGGARLAA
jgi:superfamily II DNA or RNA helicase